MFLARSCAFSFLLAVFCHPALAGISAQMSHARYSADGRRILVMVSHVPSHERFNTPTFTLPSGHTVSIRDVFSKSGCYDAATLTPIWQVEWFSLFWDLQTSPDFKHIVRRNRLAMRGGNALEFYDNSSLIGSYTCSDLMRHVTSPAFQPYATWDWHYQWYDDFELSDGDTLKLSTGHRQFWIYGHGIDLGYQEHYTFDLATGQIRSLTYSGVRRLLTVITECLTTIIAAPVICWWLFRRIRRYIRVARLPKTHCRNCGYDLTGNLSGVCPECGGALSQNVVMGSVGKST